MQPQQKQQPKVVCFICGRKQFKQILAKHLKGCQNRYKREQEKKTKEPQKPCPLPPTELHEVLKNENCPAQKIEIYNQKAMAKYKNESQPTCKKCWRQFNSEAFVGHQSSCEIKPKEQKEPPELSSLPSSSGPSLRRATSYDIDFRKPKTLTCAICGRQFGLTSLKIHHPQCLQKFTNQQSKKPKHQRRELPLMDDYFLRMMNLKEEWNLDEIEEFNNEANRIYREKGLVKCYNCGRAFFIESIEKHRKNCKLIFGEINMYEEPQPVPKEENMAKPRVVMCHICGREFGTKSLLIHQKQCVQKFLNEQRKKPKLSDQKPIPQLPQQLKSQFNLNTLSNWSTQQLQQYNSKVFDFYNKRTLQPCPNCHRTFLPSSLVKHLKGCHSKSQPHRSYSAPPIQQPKQPRKPKTLICYICGREFGLTSLPIHQPQCEVRYRNEEARKDIDDRKDLPQVEEKYMGWVSGAEADWTGDRIEEFNKYMFEVYKGMVLEKCYTCGRTFFHQSLLKHKKFCVKREQTSPIKNSPKANSTKLISKPSVKFIVQKVVEQQQNQDQQQPSPNTNNKATSRKTQVDFNRFLKPTIASSTKIDRRTVPVQPTTPRTPKVQQVQRPKVQPKQKVIRKEPLPKFTTKSGKKIEVKGQQEEGKKESKTSIELEEAVMEVEREERERSRDGERSRSDQEDSLQNINKQFTKEEKDQLHLNLNKQSAKGNRRIKTQANQGPQIQLNLQQIKLESPTRLRAAQSQGTKCQFCNKRMDKALIQKHYMLCLKKPKPSPKINQKSFNLQQQLQRCMKCHQRFSKSHMERHMVNCKGTKQEQINPRKKVSSQMMVQKNRKQTENQFSLESIGVFPVSERESEFEECSKCKRKFLKQAVEEHMSLCVGRINEKKAPLPSPKRSLNRSFTQNSSKGILNNFSTLQQKSSASQVQNISNASKSQVSNPRHNSIMTSNESKNLLKQMTDMKNRKKPTESNHSQLNKSSADLKKVSEINKTGKQPSKPQPDKARNKTTHNPRKDIQF